ncbi:MAG: competence/damage-inducible protein A [Defluviitaleaceae bacterium]|nr:competence/damage-inducible protein A [Defluviitaleaceae bacterium]
MTAEIISVGTELLLGDTVNTDATFLSQEMAALGISVFIQTVVGDNPERLKQAYADAFERGADLIVATGGLGPTEDDITKEVAAAYFNQPLILHVPTWGKIQSMFAKFNPNQQITPNNQKQAMVPEGAHIFPNPNGTAPGIYMEDNHRMMILMPGPPNELIPMFHAQVGPFLRGKSGKVLVSKVLKVAGVGESAVEHRIKDVIAGQDNPTIAPYAKTAEVWLRITASASCEADAKKLIAPVAVKLREILGNAVYGEDDDTLEGVVAGLLQQRGYTLSCAESCTGGLLTAKMVNHPGVSEVLHEGIVAYANEAKIHRLGVDADFIARHGAVSPEVAAAMAEGAARLSGASVGISTTGVAGPGGGTADKPVGRVYVGLYLPGVGTKTKELTMVGDRSKIRGRATMAALDFLRLALIGD